MWIYILERTRHFTTKDLPMNRFFDSTNLEKTWQTDCKLICFNSSSLDDDLWGFQWFERRGFNLEDTTCIAIVTKCHPSNPRESSPKWPDIFLLSEIIDSTYFFHRPGIWRSCKAFRHDVLSLQRFAKVANAHVHVFFRSKWRLNRPQGSSKKSCQDGCSY